VVEKEKGGYNDSQQRGSAGKSMAAINKVGDLVAKGGVWGVTGVGRMV